MTRRRTFPWFTLTMLFAATAMSFLDRQVLSTLAPRIIAEFGMSNSAYSHVIFAFQLSYTAMSAVGGYLIDRIGVKRGLGLSLGLWSLASAAHAIARSVLWLGIARFVLGIGEGACFPAATRGAADYGPSDKRSFATGFAIGGSALGAVIAPPLTVLLSTHFGWRGAFLFTGLFGFAWLSLWLIFVPSAPRSSATVRVPYRSLLRDRRLKWLLCARFLFDPVFYFYMFWIPQFLSRERGLSVEAIGNLFWIPFFVLGISQIFGGKITDRLIANGREPVSAKRLMLLLSAIVTPISWVSGLATNVHWAIACMSLLLFAHGIWITNYLALAGDLFPKEQNASVVGLTGMIGGIGGMVSTLLVGPTIDHFSFVPVFALSGVLYPLAYVCIRFAMRGDRPIIARSESIHQPMRALTP
jgi:MFS transporter, ACS family, hexuronate transporter